MQRQEEVREDERVCRMRRQRRCRCALCNLPVLWQIEIMTSHESPFFLSFFLCFHLEIESREGKGSYQNLMFRFESLSPFPREDTFLSRLR